MYYILHNAHLYVKRPYVQNIFLQQINSNEERQRQNFERFRREINCCVLTSYMNLQTKKT